jgi:hypothetical protein
VKARKKNWPSGREVTTPVGRPWPTNRSGSLVALAVSWVRLLVDDNVEVSALSDVVS